MAHHDLLAAVAAGVTVYDLGRPYTIGMPQSPNHPAYWHSLPRRHGDMVRPDGGSAANDLIVLGTHVGTHMDALAHVSHEGRLHGGIDAASAQAGGRFSQLGIDEVDPLICRGVLLDVASTLGVEACPPAYEVTPDDLAVTVKQQGVELQPGDMVFIRSGWARRWHDRDAYIGRESGVPGPGAAGAQWLAEHQPRVVGADTIAFEHLPAGAGHSILPAHRVLLVEAGINIIETAMLDDLARDRVHEFLALVVPLKLVGATGSPVRPLAIVGGHG
jgi:kynurenine formamidase